MTPAWPARTWSSSAERIEVPLRVVYAAERVAAAIAILLLAPFALAIGVTIALLSRRGPLVSHTRVGWRGEPLHMLKFRTMWSERETRGNLLKVENVSGAVPVSKAVGDARVRSGFAAFCRRYSLDELPQLFHVIRGEMSLVGPRPITLAELNDYYGDCAGEVLSLRPGLTGLWQIMGRSRLTYAERRELDLKFVRGASSSLYFGILLRSIPRVFSGSGSY